MLLIGLLNAREPNKKLNYIFNVLSYCSQELIDIEFNCSFCKSLFLANELFGKMSITIIVLVALSFSENFKPLILVLMGNFLARNCLRSVLLYFKILLEF